MASNTFADTKYLTTNEDIRAILKRCKRCLKTSGDGNFILLLDELHDYRINMNPQSKMSLFINTQKSNETTLEIGHWILLCCKGRKCIVLNSLQETDQRTKLYIETFCRNNKLTSHYFSARYQDKTSKSCGFLCLFMHSQFTHNNLHSLYKMRHSILTTPVKYVEAAMIKKVSKHFRIRF